MSKRPTLLLAVLTCLPLSSCGPSATPPPEAAKATPYLGYFETLRPTGIYLFADLDMKQRFERGSEDLRFRQYVDRTGVLVYVHAPTPTGGAPTLEPTQREIKLREEGRGSMIERIARGYEVSRDTRLTLRTDPDAPPVEPYRPELYPGDPATRESMDQPTTEPATRTAPGEAPGTAPAQPGETPVGRQERPDQPEGPAQASEPGSQEVGPGSSGQPSPAGPSDPQQAGPGGGAQPSENPEN